MNRFLIVFLLGSLSGFVDGQSNYFEKGDSLRYAENYQASIRAYQRGLTSVRVGSDNHMKYTIRLGISYFLQGDSKNALSKYQVILELTKMDTINIYRAHALNNIGLIKDNYGEFYESIRNYELARDIYSFLGDELMVDVTMMNIGIIYKKLGRLKPAILNITTAASGFEKRGDHFQLSEAYSSIGGIQENLNNYSKALHFYNKSLQTRLKLDDKSGTASVMNNIGGVYLNQQLVDSAIYFFKGALSLMRDYGERNAGVVMHNLGKAYAMSEQPSKARWYFKQAFDFKKELNDTSEMAITLNERALFELHDGNTKEAHSILNYSRHIVNATKSKSILLKNYEIWRDYYKSIGNLDSVIFYFEMAESMKKGLSNETYLKELALLQEEFESKSKDLIIDTLAQGYTRKQNTIGKLTETASYLKRNLIILTIAFVLVTGIILLLFFVQKQRATHQKLKAQLDGIESEKKRISLELHDAVGASLKDIQGKLYTLSENGNLQSEDIRQISKKLKIVTNRIVNISHILHHPEIDQINFAEFIQDFLFDAFDGAIEKLFLDDREIDVFNLLSIEVREQIFRCLQEIIANIKQHANANEVRIAFSTTMRQFKIQVVDNGNGYIADKPHGIWIKNMAERLRLVSGRLEIEFLNESKGTAVRITLPI